jgi:hypothetical protein
LTSFSIFRHIFLSISEKDKCDSSSIVLATNEDDEEDENVVEEEICSVHGDANVSKILDRRITRRFVSWSICSTIGDCKPTGYGQSAPREFPDKCFRCKTTPDPPDTDADVEVDTEVDVEPDAEDELVLGDLVISTGWVHEKSLTPSANFENVDVDGVDFAVFSFIQETT